jgi:hypothetical protein
MAATTETQLVWSARETARRAGISVDLLKKLDRAGDGPPRINLGRRVVYRPVDVATWL